MRFRGIQNEATEKSKKSLFSLLSRGYQLLYYDANGKMLAVYANEIAWADVSEAENGAVTAEALTAAAPTAEEIGAVSLSKLYVYYGSHENRSREGEGVWLILNPRQKRPDRVMPCITRKLRSRSFGSRMGKLC